MNIQINKMEKEFVAYEQALALKGLGFDEPCFGFYIASQLFVTLNTVYNSSNIPVCKAPLYQQAFRWFREKYNLHCNIDPWGYCIFDDNNTEKTGFKTYEKSQFECLKNLIEIVKNKINDK